MTDKTKYPTDGEIEQKNCMTMYVNYYSKESFSIESINEMTKNINSLPDIIAAGETFVVFVNGNLFLHAVSTWDGDGGKWTILKLDRSSQPQQ